jgi:hypothetical protein
MSLFKAYILLDDKKDRQAPSLRATDDDIIAAQNPIGWAFFQPANIQLVTKMALDGVTPEIAKFLDPDSVGKKMAETYTTMIGYETRKLGLGDVTKWVNALNSDVAIQLKNYGIAKVSDSKRYTKFITSPFPIQSPQLDYHRDKTIVNPLANSQPADNQATAETQMNMLTTTSLKESDQSDLFLGLSKWAAPFW